MVKGTVVAFPLPQTFILIKLLGHLPEPCFNVRASNSSLKCYFSTLFDSVVIFVCDFPKLFTLIYKYPITDMMEFKFKPLNGSIFTFITSQDLPFEVLAMIK